MSDEVSEADETVEGGVKLPRGGGSSSTDVDLTGLSQLAAMRSRVSELETQLEASRRECHKSQELNAKLQFDLHEVHTLEHLDILVKFEQ